MTKIKYSTTWFSILICSLIPLGCNTKVQKSKDTVVIGIGSIPSTLDPRYALDSEGMKIGSLIFQSLVKIGPDMQVVGDAAENWKLDIVNPNSFKLKFKLKSNLIFSNGNNITCTDLIFSIQEYKAESSPFKSAFSNITNVTCEGLNLILSFNEYSEKVLNSDLPVIKILPKDEVEKHQQNFKDILIGSGAYQVSKIKETEINLSINKNYNIDLDLNESDLKSMNKSVNNIGKKNRIKNLQFKVIKDDFTRFLKMYRGDLDLAVSSLPKNKIKSLEKLKNLEIIKKPGLSMAYLLINLKNKELQKLENRKILFEGIDRNEIIKYKLENLAQPATSILTPSNPYFWPGFLNLNKINSDSNILDLKNTDPPALSNDKSLEILRTKVLNSELSKIILNLKTSNTREAVENAKLIATQLRNIGLRINHESYEWGTYYKDIKQGEYDLATMTWVGAYDPDIYRLAFSSQELPPDGRNRGYYLNTKFDELVINGAKELDPEKRKNIYYQAQQIIYNDLAIIPLWYEDTITVIDRRIKNYKPSLNGDYSGLIFANF